MIDTIDQSQNITCPNGERSGSVVECLRPKGRRFEPHRRHCVVVIEQDTFILAYYCFNLGRPVPI